MGIAARMNSRLDFAGTLLLVAGLGTGAAQAQTPVSPCTGPPSAPVAAGGAPAREPTVKDYEQILQRQPRNAREYYDHGVLHERMDQYTSAILDYSRAIALDPCLAQAY